jgi:ligand-binding sensor domain-containing protein
MAPVKPRVIALCAASAISVGLASGEQLPLKIYSTAEGLTSDRIHCILSDSHGFLWFGTEDGLSRFDGYGFRNFNESDGLPAAAVTAMIESRDGVYWLGTTRGLVRFDATRETARSGSSFRVFHVPGGGLFDQAESLLEDRSGVLWMGTEDGLFRVERGLPRLAAENITGGCGGGNYCPLNPNTRGQMAVFIVKTFTLQ